MVVGMMKWRPWPPQSSNKFKVKIIIGHLQGLLQDSATTAAYDGGQDVSKLAVEVVWKGCNKPNNPLSFKRRSVRRNVTKDGCWKDDGVVEWNEEFVSVCSLFGLKDDGFHRWDVAFMVFDGSNQEQKKRYCAVATGSLNLAKFASSSEQNGTDISIPLSAPGGIAESGPILCVSPLNIPLSKISFSSLRFGQLTFLQRFVFPHLDPIGLKFCHFPPAC
ncbi:putative NT-type C2 domain-containing protein [Helianthus anomalus]